MKSIEELTEELNVVERELKWHEKHILGNPKLTRFTKHWKRWDKLMSEYFGLIAKILEKRRLTNGS